MLFYLIRIFFNYLIFNIKVDVQPVTPSPAKGCLHVTTWDQSFPIPYHYVAHCYS